MLRGIDRWVVIFCCLFNFATALNLNDFDWKQLMSNKGQKQSKISKTKKASQPIITNNYCGIPYKNNAMCLSEGYVPPSKLSTSNDYSAQADVQSGYQMSGAFNNTDNSQQIGVQRALGGVATQALMNSSTPLINRIDVPITIDSNTKLKLNQQQIQIDVNY